MSETEAPMKPEAPEAEPARPSSAGGVIALLLLGLLVVLGGAGAGGWVLWSQMLDLRAELAALRDLPPPAVEAAPSAPLPAPQDLSPLHDRLSVLEGQIAELKARPLVPERLGEQVAALDMQLAELRRNAADAASVLRLSVRLEKAESGIEELKAPRSSAAQMLLSVGLLQGAVDAGRAFDSELRALKALARDDEAIAPLLEPIAGAAGTGIPTKPVLEARFDALVPRLVQADILPEQDGWWRRTLARLATLVSVRREDGAAAGDSAPAIIARARDALARGNLEGAIIEMEALSGRAADEAGPWLNDARNRLIADKTLSELAAQVVAAAGARP